MSNRALELFDNPLNIEVDLEEDKEEEEDDDEDEKEDGGEEEEGDDDDDGDEVEIDAEFIDKEMTDEEID